MRLYKFLKKEFFHILPLYIFYLVFFTIINEVETYFFIKAGITPIRFIEIAIAAALIAKIVLVLDHLKFIKLFDKKPLIYPIIWKTLNYWVCLFVVRVLVRFSSFAFHQDQGFMIDLHKFQEDTDWSLFFSIQLIYFLFLMIYVTFKELSEKIGDAKIKKLFLG